MLCAICYPLGQFEFQKHCYTLLNILWPLRSQSQTNKFHLKSVLQQHVQFNRVAASDIDDILHQYEDYADNMIHDHHELFASFNPSASRLDTLMVTIMSRNDLYSKLWKVVKMLLVLSHGQATVEQGFSINKQVETENLSEESVVAKRTICDYVTYVGGIEHDDATNKKLTRRLSVRPSVRLSIC